MIYHKFLTQNKQLVCSYPHLYKKLHFITLFRTVHHWSTFRPKQMQSTNSKTTPSNNTSLLLLTHSIQHSPSWEANRFSASQETPHILWNPKVHYCSHKCTPSSHILCQLDPAHILTSYFLKIHLNIILPSMPWSPKWSFRQFFTQKSCTCLSPLHATCQNPSNSSRFYHPSNIGWAVQIIKLLIM